MESTGSAKTPAWVFWSTRETIENDIPSVTGVIETVLAVAFYWWITVYFDTVLPLLLSVATAPLVLLRSDQSIRLGANLFWSWVNRYHITDHPTVSRSTKRLPWILISIPILLASILCYTLSDFSHDLGRWAAWWISAFIGLTSIGIVGLFSEGEVHIVRSLASIKPVVVAIGVMAVSLIAVLGAATLRMGFGEIEGIVGILFGALVAAVLFIAVIWLDQDKRSILSPVSIFVASLVIRFGATLRHLGSGIQNLPRNFRRLTLCTSPTHEPELVPGLLRGEGPFTLPDVLEAFRNKRRDPSGFDRILSYVTYPLTILIWFLPGWLYRVTLKSTAWFWWPLAFLGGDLQSARRPELFRQTIMETLLAKASIGLALMTISAFLAGNLLLTGAIITEPNPFLSVIGFLFLIDWRSVGIWQFLLVAAAVLSIIILVWTEKASREYRYAHEHHDSQVLSMAERKFGWIERFVRFRLVLVILFWLIVGGHVLLFFNSRRCWIDIPKNVERWAVWIYDKRTPIKSCTEDVAQITYAPIINKSSAFNRSAPLVDIGGVASFSAGRMI